MGIPISGASPWSKSLENNKGAHRNSEEMSRWEKAGPGPSPTSPRVPGGRGLHLVFAAEVLVVQIFKPALEFFIVDFVLHAGLAF